MRYMHTIESRGRLMRRPPPAVKALHQAAAMGATACTCDPSRPPYLRVLASYLHACA